MEIQAFTQGIKEKLNKLEKEINNIFASDPKTVSFIGRQNYLTGGKRIRPILLLLSSQLCGYGGEKDIPYAIVVEIIHNATLIHDDIIDNSNVRRGKPSVNSQLGNSLSVLVGDYLYIKAIDMALKDENLEIVRILSTTTRKMIVGELMQNTQLADTSLSEEDYLDIIKAKTAYLFSACSLIGAILSNSSTEIKKALFQFGLHLGTAFQLIDDMFNFSSQEDTLGKPIGNDLLEGKITLPIILMLQQSTKEERTKVVKIIQEKKYNSVKMEEIIALLNKYDSLMMTKERAALYVEKAKKNLDCFPDCPARENLMLMADFIIQREK